MLNCCSPLWVAIVCSREQTRIETGRLHRTRPARRIVCSREQTRIETRHGPKRTASSQSSARESRRGLKLFNSRNNSLDGRIVCSREQTRIETICFAPCSMCGPSSARESRRGLKLRKSKIVHPDCRSSARESRRGLKLGSGWLDNRYVYRLLARADAD